MKKYIILFTMTVAVATTSVAQEGVLTEKGGATTTAALLKVEVQEVYQTMSKGQNNSFIMQLPGDDKKMAVSVWRDLMKEYKGKVRKRSGEYVTETDRMTPLGAGPVFVYAKFDRQEISVWFEHDGNFIDTRTNPANSAFIMELFNDYRFNLRKELALKSVEENEKHLKSLEKELYRLEKENQRLHDTIERAKKAIADAEQGIEVNEKDQEAKRVEIEEQKTTVEEAKEAHRSITKYRKSKQ